MMSRDEQLRILRDDVTRMVTESGVASGFDGDAWLELWLQQPLPAFGGRIPSDLLADANGFELVRCALLANAPAPANLASRANLATHKADARSRIAKIESLAKETFETEEEAVAWLQRPHPVLDGQAPRQVASTSDGAKRVREILIAIKYGGVV